MSMANAATAADSVDSEAAVSCRLSNAEPRRVMKSAVRRIAETRKTASPRACPARIPRFAGC